MCSPSCCSSSSSSSSSSEASSSSSLPSSPPLSPTSVLWYLVAWDLLVIGFEFGVEEKVWRIVARSRADRVDDATR